MYWSRCASLAWYVVHSIGLLLQDRAPAVVLHGVREGFRCGAGVLGYHRVGNAGALVISEAW